MIINENFVQETLINIVIKTEKLKDTFIEREELHHEYVLEKAVSIKRDLDLIIKMCEKKKKSDVKGFLKMMKEKDL